MNQNLSYFPLVVAVFWCSHSFWVSFCLFVSFVVAVSSFMLFHEILACVFFPWFFFSPVCFSALTDLRGGVLKGFCHVAFVLNVVTEFSSSSSLALCFVSQGFFFGWFLVQGEREGNSLC